MLKGDTHVYRWGDSLNEMESVPVFGDEPVADESALATIGPGIPGGVAGVRHRVDERVTEISVDRRRGLTRQGDIVSSGRACRRR